MCLMFVLLMNLIVDMFDKRIPHDYIFNKLKAELTFLKSFDQLIFWWATNVRFWRKIWLDFFLQIYTFRNWKENPSRGLLPISWYCQGVLKVKVYFQEEKQQMIILAKRCDVEFCLQLDLWLLIIVILN